ncbi:MAG: sensor domain-containing diguanylate cyclase [Syntrophomonadaceae bacterium]|nr:sensor domain-containing diguanylate cyclase [Syntrophomonadaceae bacterium]MDD3271102.1 sensor domain-containing diguanylate cyclase [Syntrophomonadaceae bacterium]MDD3897936.1 sensor domain-containing diguanylate cyclase [Syntrophomonadaceae bacterium]MDD4562651.1 sensor domain-containing diguanylate cyclase [Syntrophomonadaceae bacterium]
MRQFIRKFQIALTGIVLLLALSLLAIMFPVQNELMKSERSNFCTEAGMYLITVNNFIDNCIQDTEGLCCCAEIRHKILDYHSGKLGREELVSFAQPQYVNSAARLKNCVLAVRLVDNQIISSYGNQSIIKEIDLPRRYETYPAVNYLNYKGRPFFIVWNPLICEEEIIAYDIAIFNPTAMLAEMNLIDYQLKIIPQTDLNLGEMNKVDVNLFTHNNTTWFVGKINHSNALLLLGEDNSILYKSVYNSTVTNMLIVALSLIATMSLIYFFVYRQALQLLSQLRHANKDLQVEKARAEKLAQGQQHLFNIFRYLSASRSVDDDFEIISRSLPFIINFRNCLMAVQESKESNSFTIRELTGELTSQHLGTMLIKKGTILEQAIATGRPFYSGNVQLEIEGIQLYHNEIESLIIAPIVYSNFNWGLVAIDHLEKEAFTELDFELMNILASHIALHLEEMEAKNKLNQQALIDPLTGIWNRRYMMKRIEEEEEKLKRHGGEACVAILDLGNLKMINDCFGHNAGDEVLKATANAITQSIRSMDTVGRYGGDEFIVLFPSTSPEEAQTALQRVNEEISKQRPPGVNIDVFADFGIACSPLDTPRLLDAINIADARMYNHKRERNAEPR